MHNQDVIIIGGGAAGLSAALVLARARRSVTVVDSRQPRNAAAAHMQGFLSRDGLPPLALIEAGRREVASYGAQLIDGAATTIYRTDSGFRVELASAAPLTARRVLVTTGLHDAIPDIPGATGRWGRDLLHCPYCHGYEVRDRPLGVVGGTPQSIEHALLVRQWSEDVIYFPHTDTVEPADAATLAARGARVEAGTVTGLVVTDDHLEAVELDGGRVVPRAAVFVRPRLVPNSDLLTALGATTNDAGWVVADGAGRTSVSGLYAAGNAINPRALVITAAGEGSAAAIAINADLVDEDVDVALQSFEVSPNVH